MRQPSVLRLNGNLSAIVTAAALALAGVAGGGSVYAASTITALNTTTIAGAAQDVDNVNGAGWKNDFPEAEQYDLTYTGDVTRLNSVTTSAGTFHASTPASFVFRRTNTPDADITWFHAAHNTSNDQVTLYGPKPSTLGDMFAGNNLNIGVDNMFANRSDGNGNFSNIERVDFVFSGGLTAAATKGFAVVERGNVGDHDGFGIVAITGIDQAGNPTAYGTLKSFGFGAWGNTALGAKQDYVVMRRDNYEEGAVFAPSAHVNNTMGGVFVPLTDLAAAGTTIYGFSLVGADVHASGSNLVDWSNDAYFPNDTLNDNDGRDAFGNPIITSPGGLDPTGTLALLYEVSPPPLSPVPEPGSLALLAMAALPLLRRTRRA